MLSNIFLGIITASALATSPGGTSAPAPNAQCTIAPVISRLMDEIVFAGVRQGPGQDHPLCCLPAQHCIPHMAEV